MKKLLIFAISLVVIFVSFQNSYAKTFWRTYEVAEITKEGLVLKDFEGQRFLVNKDPSGYKVGDVVRYDSVKDRLKMSAWQPATVLTISDSSVTMQLNNGDTVDVPMKSSYRDQFKEGDQVNYKAVTGQIKKSNLQPVDEE